jgi:hypothetical protein
VPGRPLCYAIRERAASSLALLLFIQERVTKLDATCFAVVDAPTSPWLESGDRSAAWLTPNSLADGSVADADEAITTLDRGNGTWQKRESLLRFQARFVPLSESVASYVCLAVACRPGS